MWVHPSLDYHPLDPIRVHDLLSRKPSLGYNCTPMCMYSTFAVGCLWNLVTFNDSGTFF